MPVVTLANLDDPRLRVFSSMTDSELRDPKQMVGLALACSAKGLENGLFIAESRNVIKRALAGGAECFALLVERRWAAQEETQALIERLLAGNPNLPVFIADAAQRKAITGYESTRGPLAAFHRPAPRDLHILLADAQRVAVLEDITNFTNIGAIFRSAAALGIDAVLITPGCHDPLYRRASRVSMGTVFQVPWGYIGASPADDSSNAPQNAHWSATGIPLLRAHGFKTAALALSPNSIPLHDPHLREYDKLALVLGTEGDGLTQQTIASCDYTVRIPMSHNVDSLNVAAASAVAFWELCAKPHN